MTKIYEMRVYRCLPGRLPDLLKRFETYTPKLWDKYNIRPVGCFTTIVGESNHDFTYLLEWNSMSEREEKWSAFQADPELLSARIETEKSGPIIVSIANSFLRPTAFSSI